MDITQTPCRVCGADTHRRNLGDPPRKFCSLACYHKSRSGQRPQIPPELLGGGKRGRRKQRLALRGRPQSAEHRRKRAESVARTLAVTIRMCRKCGEGFTPTQSAQRYCSGRCWNAAHRKPRQQRFTIPRDEYSRLLRQQNNCCAICGSVSASNGRKDRLAVDHVHGTDLTRGLLCHRCNTALGLFRDDPDLLLKARRYLALRPR